MTYDKKTNKTAKTAKIYVPYEKIKRRKLRLCIMLGFTRQSWSKLPLLLPAKSFRYCSAYSLDRKSCSRLSCISARGQGLKSGICLMLNMPSPYREPSTVIPSISFTEA